MTRMASLFSKETLLYDLSAIEQALHMTAEVLHNIDACILQIEGKLLQYREFMTDRAYKRLGFHNCMVIILTTRPLDGVAALAARLFASPPAWLLLQRTEDWAHARHFPNIDGTVPKRAATFRMLSTPYVRVGHAPFSLQQLMEVPIDHS